MPPPARWCRGRRSGAAVVQAVQHTGEQLGEARCCRVELVTPKPSTSVRSSIGSRCRNPEGALDLIGGGPGSVRLPPDRAARGLRHTDEGDVAADHLDRGHVDHAVGGLESCRLLRLPDESFTPRRRRGVPAADSVQPGPWRAQHLQRLPGVMGESDPSVDPAAQAERTAAPEEPDGMGQKAHSHPLRPK